MSDPKKSNLARSATISSAAPLKHKDKAISKGTRARFEALELDILLSEYRAVAEESKKAQSTEEDLQDDGEEQEAEWLESAGLGHLAAKIEDGEEITAEDLAQETAGLSLNQVKAIKQRADTLNATLSSRRGRSPKPSAKEIFAQPAQPDSSDRDQEIARLKEQSEIPCLFQDLSEEDQARVRQLNLIELTTLLESVGKQMPVYRSKSARRKRKKSIAPCIYGGSLSDMVLGDRQQHPTKMSSPDIPLFLSRIIDFLRQNCLDEEGLFRKAGSAARIKVLRQQCEETHGDVDFEGCRPNDASSMLKQFFRELADPLLSSEYLEAFSLTQFLRDDQLTGLQLLVMLLPKVHQACLKLLLEFLAEVAAHSDQNKMTINNLAVVFAPTLFYMRGRKGEVMLAEIEMQVISAQTLRTMIEHQHELWNVPSSILAQIRYVNECRQKGRKLDDMKDLKRLVTEHKLKPINPASLDEQLPSIEWVKGSTSNPPIIARVTVVLSTGERKSNIEVSLTTRVSDILQIVKAPPTDHLFEFGGNICYRKLHPDAMLFPIMKVNPNMSFMIMSST